MIIDQYTPTIRVLSKVYGTENVTIVLEWTQQVKVVYNVRVVPLAPLTCAGNTNCRLTLLYNTDYKFNVVATTTCNNFTAILELKFGEVFTVYSFVMDIMQIILC